MEQVVLSGEVGERGLCSGEAKPAFETAVVAHIFGAQYYHRARSGDFMEALARMLRIAEGGRLPCLDLPGLAFSWSWEVEAPMPKRGFLYKWSSSALTTEHAISTDIRPNEFHHVSPSKMHDIRRVSSRHVGTIAESWGFINLLNRQKLIS